MSSNDEPPKKQRAIGGLDDTPPPTWRKEIEAEFNRAVGELRLHAGAKSAVVRVQGVAYGFVSGDDDTEDINRELSRLAAEEGPAGEDAWYAWKLVRVSDLFTFAGEDTEKMQREEEKGPKKQGSQQQKNEQEAQK